MKLQKNEPTILWKDLFNLKFDCGIIGAGHLASAFAEALSDVNLLSWILARSQISREKIARYLSSNVSVITKIADITSIPKLIILAVTDNVIEKAANKLSKKFMEQLKDKYIIHCSGSLSANILSSCRANGARTAAVHPYQTFYYPSKSNFIGIKWGIESDDESFEFLDNFVKILGGTSHKMSEENIRLKSLYHASAVAASNFLSTAIELSRQLASKAGIPPEEFIQPIVITTLENNFRAIADGKPAALTGPIARGEIVTIKQHLSQLKKNDRLRYAYIHFALATTELAFQSKSLSKKTYLAIKSLLTDILPKR